MNGSPTESQLSSPAVGSKRGSPTVVNSQLQQALKEQFHRKGLDAMEHDFFLELERNILSSDSDSSSLSQFRGSIVSDIGSESDSTLLGTRSGVGGSSESKHSPIGFGSPIPPTTPTEGCSNASLPTRGETQRQQHQQEDTKENNSEPLLMDLTTRCPTPINEHWLKQEIQNLQTELDELAEVKHKAEIEAHEWRLKCCKLETSEQICKAKLEVAEKDKVHVQQNAQADLKTAEKKIQDARDATQRAAELQKAADDRLLQAQADCRQALEWAEQAEQEGTLTETEKKSKRWDRLTKEFDLKMRYQIREHEQEKWRIQLQADARVMEIHMEAEQRCVEIQHKAEVQEAEHKRLLREREKQLDDQMDRLKLSQQSAMALVHDLEATANQQIAAAKMDFETSLKLIRDQSAARAAQLQLQLDEVRKVEESQLQDKIAQLVRMTESSAKEVEYSFGKAIVEIETKAESRIKKGSQDLQRCIKVLQDKYCETENVLTASSLQYQQLLIECREKWLRMEAKLTIADEKASQHQKESQTLSSQVNCLQILSTGKQKCLNELRAVLANLLEDASDEISAQPVNSQILNFLQKEEYGESKNITNIAELKNHWLKLKDYALDKEHKIIRTSVSRNEWVQLESTMDQLCEIEKQFYQTLHNRSLLKAAAGTDPQLTNKRNGGNVSPLLQSETSNKQSLQLNIERYNSVSTSPIPLSFFSPTLNASASSVSDIDKKEKDTELLGQIDRQKHELSCIYNCNSELQSQLCSIQHELMTACESKGRRDIELQAETTLTATVNKWRATKDRMSYIARLKPTLVELCSIVVECCNDINQCTRSIQSISDEYKQTESSTKNESRPSSAFVTPYSQRCTPTPPPPDIITTPSAIKRSPSDIRTIVHCINALHTSTYQLQDEVRPGLKILADNCKFLYSKYKSTMAYFSQQKEEIARLSTVEHNFRNEQAQRKAAVQRCQELEKDLDARQRSEKERVRTSQEERQTWVEHLNMLENEVHHWKSMASDKATACSELKELWKEHEEGTTDELAKMMHQAKEKDTQVQQLTRKQGELEGKLQQTEAELYAVKSKLLEALPSSGSSDDSLRFARKKPFGKLLDVDSASSYASGTDERSSTVGGSSKESTVGPSSARTSPAERDLDVSIELAVKDSEIKALAGKLHQANKDREDLKKRLHTYEETSSPNGQTTSTPKSPLSGQTCHKAAPTLSVGVNTIENQGDASLKERCMRQLEKSLVERDRKLQICEQHRMEVFEELQRWGDMATDYANQRDDARNEAKQLKFTLSTLAEEREQSCVQVTKLQHVIKSNEEHLQRSCSEREVMRQQIEALTMVTKQQRTAPPKCLQPIPTKVSTATSQSVADVSVIKFDKSITDSVCDDSDSTETSSTESNDSLDSLTADLRLPLMGNPIQKKEGSGRKNREVNRLRLQLRELKQLIEEKDTEIDVLQKQIYCNQEDVKGTDQELQRLTSEAQLKSEAVEQLQEDLDKTRSEFMARICEYEMEVKELKYTLAKSDDINKHLQSNVNELQEQLLQSNQWEPPSEIRHSNISGDWNSVLLAEEQAAAAAAAAHNNHNNGQHGNHPSAHTPGKCTGTTTISSTPTPNKDNLPAAAVNQTTTSGAHQTTVSTESTITTAGSTENDVAIDTSIPALLRHKMQQIWEEAGASRTSLESCIRTREQQTRILETRANEHMQRGDTLQAQLTAQQVVFTKKLAESADNYEVMHKKLTTAIQTKDDALTDAESKVQALSEKLSACTSELVNATTQAAALSEQCGHLKTEKANLQEDLRALTKSKDNELAVRAQGLAQLSQELQTIQGEHETLVRTRIDDVVTKSAQVEELQQRLEQASTDALSLMCGTEDEVASKTVQLETLITQLEQCSQLDSVDITIEGEDSPSTAPLLKDLRTICSSMDSTWVTIREQIKQVRRQLQQIAKDTELVVKSKDSEIACKSTALSEAGKQLEHVKQEWQVILRDRDTRLNSAWEKVKTTELRLEQTSQIHMRFVETNKEKQQESESELAKLQLKATDMDLKLREKTRTDEAMQEEVHRVEFHYKAKEQELSQQLHDQTERCKQLEDRLTKSTGAYNTSQKTVKRLMEESYSARRETAEAYSKLRGVVLQYELELDMLLQKGIQGESFIKKFGAENADKKGVVEANNSKLSHHNNSNGSNSTLVDMDALIAAVNCKDMLLASRQQEILQLKSKINELLAELKVLKEPIASTEAAPGDGITAQIASVQQGIVAVIQQQECSHGKPNKDSIQILSNVQRSLDHITTLCRASTARSECERVSLRVQCEQLQHEANQLALRIHAKRPASEGVRECDHPMDIIAGNGARIKKDDSQDSANGVECGTPPRHTPTAAYNSLNPQAQQGPNGLGAGNSNTLPISPNAAITTTPTTPPFGHSGIKDSPPPPPASECDSPTATPPPPPSSVESPRSPPKELSPYASPNLFYNCTAAAVEELESKWRYKMEQQQLTHDAFTKQMEDEIEDLGRQLIAAKEVASNLAADAVQREKEKDFTNNGNVSVVSIGSTSKPDGCKMSSHMASLRKQLHKKDARIRELEKNLEQVTERDVTYDLQISRLVDVLGGISNADYPIPRASSSSSMRKSNSPMRSRGESPTRLSTGKSPMHSRGSMTNSPARSTKSSARRNESKAEDRERHLVNNPNNPLSSKPSTPAPTTTSCANSSANSTTTATTGATGHIDASVVGKSLQDKLEIVINLLEKSRQEKQRQDNRVYQLQQRLQLTTQQSESLQTKMKRQSEQLHDLEKQKESADYQHAEAITELEATSECVSQLQRELQVQHCDIHTALSEKYIGQLRGLERAVDTKQARINEIELEMRATHQQCRVYQEEIDTKTAQLMQREREIENMNRERLRMMWNGRDPEVKDSQIAELLTTVKQQKEALKIWEQREEEHKQSKKNMQDRATELEAQLQATVYGNNPKAAQTKDKKDNGSSEPRLKSDMHLLQAQIEDLKLGLTVKEKELNMIKATVDCKMEHIRAAEDRQQKLTEELIACKKSLRHSDELIDSCKRQFCGNNDEKVAQLDLFGEIVKVRGGLRASGDEVKAVKAALSGKQSEMEAVTRDKEKTADELKHDNSRLKEEIKTLKDKTDVSLQETVGLQSQLSVALEEIRNTKQALKSSEDERTKQCTELSRTTAILQEYKGADVSVHATQNKHGSAIHHQSSPPGPPMLTPTSKRKGSLAGIMDDMDVPPPPPLFDVTSVTELQQTLDAKLIVIQELEANLLNESSTVTAQNLEISQLKATVHNMRLRLEAYEQDSPTAAHTPRSRLPSCRNSHRGDSTSPLRKRSPSNGSRGRTPSPSTTSPRNVIHLSQELTRLREKHEEDMLLIAQTNTELSQLRTDLLLKERQMLEQQHMLEKERHRRAQSPARRRQVEILTDEKEQTNKQLEESRNKIEKLHLEATELRKGMTHRDNMITDFRQQLQDAHEKEINLNQQIGDLEFEISKLKGDQQRLNQLTIDYSDIKTENDILQRKINTMAQSVVDVADMSNTIKNLRDQLAVYQEKKYNICNNGVQTDTHNELSVTNLVATLQDTIREKDSKIADLSIQIGRLQTDKESAMDTREALQHQATQNEIYLKQKITKLTTAITEKDNEIDMLTTECSKFNNSVLKLQAELSGKNERISECEKRNRELEKRYRDIDNKGATIKGDLVTANLTITAQEKLIEELQKRVAHTCTTLKEKELQYTTKKEEVSELRNTVTLSTHEISDLREQHEQNRIVIEEKTAVAINLQSEKTHLQQKYDKLSKELEDKDLHVLKLQSQLEYSANDLQKLKAERDDHDKKAKELSVKLDESEQNSRSLRQQMDSIRNTLTLEGDHEMTLKHEIERVLQHNSKLENELSICNKRYADTKLISSELNEIIAKQEKELAEANQQYQILATEHSQSDALIQELERDLNILETERRRIEAEIADVKAQVKERDTRITHLESVISEQQNVIQYNLHVMSNTSRGSLNDSILPLDHTDKQEETKHLKDEVNTLRITVDQLEKRLSSIPPTTPTSAGALMALSTVDNLITHTEEDTDVSVTEGIMMINQKWEKELNQTLDELRESNRWKILLAKQLERLQYNEESLKKQFYGIYDALKNVETRLTKLIQNCNSPNDYTIVGNNNVNVKQLLHEIQIDAQFALSIDAEVPYETSNIHFPPDHQTQEGQHNDEITKSFVNDNAQPHTNTNTHTTHGTGRRRSSTTITTTTTSQLQTGQCMGNTSVVVRSKAPSGTPIKKGRNSQSNTATNRNNFVRDLHELFQRITAYSVLTKANASKIPKVLVTDFVGIESHTKYIISIHLTDVEKLHHGLHASSDLSSSGRLSSPLRNTTPRESQRFPSPLRAGRGGATTQQHSLAIEYLPSPTSGNNHNLNLTQ